MTSAPLISVSELRRTYKVKTTGGWFSPTAELKAVDGVSFDIRPGETLGLVGESGCGKSTTAKLVLGLIPATSGKVVFEGKPVAADSKRAWREQRRRMQMVYQDPLGALDRRLPVGAQAMEPLDIFGEGTKAERRDRMLALFDAVGLPRTSVDRYPHELSGGQRQRVVLARALMLRPSLLVCDEPISALDVSIQAQVINLLKDLQEQLGVAYLFISHDLKVVRHVSHRVAVMYLGRIVESGRPEAIMRAPAHPYSQALISAVPSPRARGKERIVLEGDPPSPVDIPKGCAFHPRCPLATDRCRSEAPELRPFGEQRHVACHRAGVSITSARGAA
ncbi:oligopeptide/dipeptide ABC transporter ATP-binding protein [Hyphomicrobium sp. CS1BSMeth3]|uniref:ABC transporter ATP-binding protein n=1 Tax=Hyphomicrobium sp. CS1BSMeth3 TaxID=1892844 RepID=UPI000931DC31|nr:oligopeptide/dipeptide ABC transporter ATP-binding protein [Hyphomicrobium sp. CS1BSMeth3]